MSKKNTPNSNLSKAISIAGLMFLTFVSALFIAYFKWFPYPYFAKAFLAGDALLTKYYANLDIEKNRYNKDIWKETVFTNKGVTVYNAQKAYNGLTLYASAAGSAAYLLDMNGAIVHKWEKPFYEAWPNHEHIKMPVSEKLIHWRSAHVFPNGDIIAVYEGMTDTPYGYGLIKLDKNSKIIWKISQRIHHHFDVGADGKIYAIAQEFRRKIGTGTEFFKGPLLDDFILVISPEGKIEESYSVLNAFHFSSYSGLIRAFVYGVIWEDDPIHTNSVKIVDEKMADLLPWAEAGQFLISCREMNVIAFIDPKTRRVVWAQRGFWHIQHDIDLLKNGNMLIFDNAGVYGLYFASRVVEFNPATQKIVWEYRGDKKTPLVSKLRGAQQRLPNGNTMILESQTGRIVEVTKEKEIVWEFISPIRGGKKGELQAVATDAVRYGPGYFTFTELDKTP